MEDEGPSYLVGNLEWKILCKKRKDYDYLSLHVEVDNPCKTSGDWCCEADVTMNLVDQKSGYKWHEEFTHKFSANDKVAGKPLFKRWEQVTKPYDYLKVT